MSKSKLNIFALLAIALNIKFDWDSERIPSVKRRNYTTAWKQRLRGQANGKQECTRRLKQIGALTA